MENIDSNFYSKFLGFWNVTSDGTWRRCSTYQKYNWSNQMDGTENELLLSLIFILFNKQILNCLGFLLAIGSWVN